VDIEWLIGIQKQKLRCQMKKLIHEERQGILYTILTYKIEGADDTA